MWGATVQPGRQVLVMVQFQSTHPVWGATAVAVNPALQGCISIHAPRVGCDSVISPAFYEVHHFNPRTPCGVRPDAWKQAYQYTAFQSTHPVWGATCTPSNCVYSEGFQSTHPVWGATRSQSPVKTPRIFQSTHPVWGATGRIGQTETA